MSRPWREEKSNNSRILHLVEMKRPESKIQAFFVATTRDFTSLNNWKKMKPKLTLSIKFNYDLMH